jgi:hypothetical protein
MSAYPQSVRRDAQPAGEPPATFGLRPTTFLIVLKDEISIPCGEPCKTPLKTLVLQLHLFRHVGGGGGQFYRCVPEVFEVNLLRHPIEIAFGAAGIAGGKLGNLARHAVDGLIR